MTLEQQLRAEIAERDALLDAANKLLTEANRVTAALIAKLETDKQIDFIRSLDGGKWYMP